MSDPPAERFRKAWAKNIKKYGCQLLAIRGDNGDLVAKPPFTYTIGNQERGLPELLILGGADKTIGDVLMYLNTLMYERKRAFDDGELVSLEGQYPVKIINASPKAREIHTLQATVYYKTDQYAVQQVIIPDLEGRFPGDLGCEEPFASMPIYSIQSMN